MKINYCYFGLWKPNMQPIFSSIIRLMQKNGALKPKSTRRYCSISQVTRMEKLKKLMEDKLITTNPLHLLGVQTDSIFMVKIYYLKMIGWFLSVMGMSHTRISLIGSNIYDKNCEILDEHYEEEIVKELADHGKRLTTR